MTTPPLDLILAPDSILVLGANNNPVKMGSMQRLNLLHSGFAGQVLPVHPREKTVCGRNARPGVWDLPFAPDLVMEVIPPAGVPEIMDAFGLCDGLPRAAVALLVM